MSDSEQLPEMSFDKALENLRMLPSFQQVIAFVMEEREDMIGRFGSVINDGEAMKTAGAVAAYDKVLVTLRGQ
jgi:hypothetical protein